MIVRLVSSPNMVLRRNGRKKFHRSFHGRLRARYYRLVHVEVSDAPDLQVHRRRPAESGPGEAERVLVRCGAAPDLDKDLRLDGVADLACRYVDVQEFSGRIALRI